MKANEQKSGHNGAETIYKGCGGGKSGEGVIDGRNRRRYWMLQNLSTLSNDTHSSSTVSTAHASQTSIHSNRTEIGLSLMTAINLKPVFLIMGNQHSNHLCQ